jgi:hypothetical protein
VSANGVRATAAGALVCIAGIAVLLLAKNGLAGVTGWTALGGFVATAAAARLAATPREPVR